MSLTPPARSPRCMPGLLCPPPRRTSAPLRCCRAATSDYPLLWHLLLGRGSHAARLFVLSRPILYDIHSAQPHSGPELLGLPSDRALSRPSGFTVGASRSNILQCHAAVRSHPATTSASSRPVPHLQPCSGTVLEMSVRWRRLERWTQLCYITLRLGCSANLNNCHSACGATLWYPAHLVASPGPTLGLARPHES
jgi:hypothetical protein